MADEPPRKKMRHAISDGPDIFAPPVPILVGDQEQKLYVYENLLCANSEFFQRALKKDWQEGEAREVKLPEADVEIFKIWMQWLCTGKIFLTKEDDQTTIGGVTASREWGRWEKCYALGDYLQDHDFKEACIDVCIEGMCATDNIPMVLPGVIYAHSSSNSAHRLLAIDAFVFCGGWQNANGTNRPVAFLEDALRYIGPRLSNGVRQRKVAAYFGSVSKCRYHDHGTGSMCYRNKPTFRL